MERMWLICLVLDLQSRNKDEIILVGKFKKQGLNVNAGNNIGSWTSLHLFWIEYENVKHRMETIHGGKKLYSSPCHTYPIWAKQTGFRVGRLPYLIAQGFGDTAEAARIV